MNRFELKTNRPPENQEKEALLEAAHEKALRILDTDAIDIREFEAIYGKAEIAKDEAYVNKIEGEFAKDMTEREKRDKKLATIVEAIFHDQASHNGWLGPDTHMLRSSKLDDYANGVDGIAEYKKGDTSAYLAMAIDATWSSNPGWKFNRIREELSRGKLGKIKYLKAGDKPQRGREVPKVVVGASEKTLDEVIQMWTNDDQESLRDHPIQLLFLEEIIAQLEGFKIFSERKGHQKNVAAFEEYLSILKPILEEKRKLISPKAEYASDFVWGGIKANLVGLNFQRPAAAA